MNSCPNCGGRMTILFIHAVCDACNPPENSRPIGNGTTPDRDCVGYIVFRNRPSGSCEYVFRTNAFAEKWRHAAGLDRFPIRAVQTLTIPKWRMSAGSVSDIELADKLYEIFPDDSFPKGANRAHLI